ncbi:unnamed protein product [Rotaria sp. Silwood2]|nr:unnamed protein product [Rotaria sp. Silwood2]CAF2939713.1 unnamed protein product [Rotaria sp. Silwood2]CAF4017892.1 unnamed protein product [Rotaria sp. Silwood2]CAF4298271.1 unnamed protein product [Rotaria sp. Silwood2]
MQSNDLLRSSTSPFVRSPHLLSNDLQSQLNMLYALTQQQISSSSSSDLTLESQIKRIKKTIPMPNEPPSQVPLISATDSRTSSASDREIVKVVTTAGPQCIDKEFLTQLLLRKDVIPARKRRDFIPNEMKDDHYWERRRKNNLAAKRSREKRRLNDIVLETKVVELTNENEALKAKLNLMLSRLNMKEIEMESLFEEEQRLGHICLKPATSASTILTQRSLISDDDDHSSRSTRPKNYSSSETHDDDEVESTTFDDNSSNTRVQYPLLYNQLLGNNNNNTTTTNNNGAVDLSRTEVKTGNLLTTVPNKSPSPLTPSPSPPNESLLQILANQILKTKQQDTVTSSRLLTIASPTESKPIISSLKRNFDQLQPDDQQQQKWDEAAMTLLSLNKPPPPPPSPVEQQTALQSVCQSVINGLLRKSNPPRATIDYHSNNQQHIQGENFHHQDNINSLSQLKTLMNYFSTSSNNSFSMPPLQQSSNCIGEQHNTVTTHTQSHEPRGDMMPLKLRMKMLNAKS